MIAAATAMAGLESFTRVIEFGNNEEAVALGITDGLLPKSKLHRSAAVPPTKPVTKSPQGQHRLRRFKTRALPLKSSRSTTVGAARPARHSIGRAKAHNP